MLINFNTAETSADELTAIIALCASLGGRLPAGTPTAVRIDERTVALPNNAAEAAEMLMQHAEATRVPPPPPADEDGDENEGGAALDPATLDKEGIPWDARIHARTKTQNGDGTWRKNRSVDEATYLAVKAELKAGNGNPAPPPPSDPAADTLATDSARTEPGSSTAGDATGANGARFPSFAAFVQGVNAIRTPGIPYLELNGFASELGVPGGFKDMKDHPGLWETFFAMAGGQ